MADALSDRALDLAIKACEVGSSAAEIISKATAFRAFLAAKPEKPIE